MGQFLKAIWSAFSSLKIYEGVLLIGVSFCVAYLIDEYYVKPYRPNKNEKSTKDEDKQYQMKYKFSKKQAYDQNNYNVAEQEFTDFSSEEGNQETMKLWRTDGEDEKFFTN